MTITLGGRRFPGQALALDAGWCCAPGEGLAARLPDDLGEFECEHGGEVIVLPPPPRWGLEATPHPTG